MAATPLHSGARSTPGRILVIRGGAIGDFILTLPVLAALRASLPTARLEVLGYRHIAGLARAGGLADDVHCIEARSLAGFFAPDGPLSPALEAFFAGFAVILSYLYDPDGVFQANVARCSRAQFIAGPHRPDERGQRHATEVFLEPLQRLAIFDASAVPRLRFGASDPGGTRAERAGIVALHPGSGSERKNWPEGRWLELMEHLLAEGRELLLVGGEVEGDRLQRLSARFPGRSVEQAWHCPLVELGERLQGCALLVGHDSGISHLAAAVGIPVLALWGETSEEVWRPQGDRIRVLHGGPGLAGLAVEEVCDELRQMLSQPHPCT